ncbi:MAG: lysophospholipid acyltransferase family protein [Proteobacteria bacterium]|nr:lysophospholipid acyltransferase family protein [Pseudomonadota bacterium]
MRKLIALFRASRFALHLAYGLMIALIFPRLNQAFRRRILQQWCAQLLTILNVRIRIAVDEALPQSGILVTNHISWLDVFALNAVLPMRFVAKSDVRSWPAIGWLCIRAQTLFIERGRARDAARLNKQIVELLQGGECLAVFPEGTTTDGTHVGAFHASLLQPAIDAGTPIHPLAIRYQDAAGTHSTVAAYIDDLSFGTSLWNILNCQNLHVQLVSTPSLDASGSDRRTLAQSAHRQISDTVQLMHAARPLI